MLEIAFEYLRVPNYQMILQSACSLNALGKVTGLVVDSGFGMTQVVPICDNYLINKASCHSDFFSGITLNENI